MKIYLFTVLLLLLGLPFAQAQIIFQEDFEGGGIPAGWTIQSNATDGGWKVGTTNSLSSQSFNIISNGSSRMAATNDDACNCNKSLERFIAPRMDFTGNDFLVLKFDIFYLDNSYQGAQEDMVVEISLDSINWEVVEDLHGHGSWDTHVIDLSDYANEDMVFVAFHYSDDGGWLYGCAIDNVSIKVPAALDANLVEVEGRAFGEENTPIHIGGTVFNNGATEITSLEMSYSVNGETPVVETLDGISILPFQYYHFELPNPWMPLVAGDYTIDIEITAINGGADEDSGNNSGSFDTEIYEKVVMPNIVDDLLMAPPVFIEIANISDQLDKPTDLDFFPILGKDELWVINQRTENEGGSTLTISDASTDPSNFLQRVDGNAWHFMSLPTGIAFSDDNFNFATSPGVQDANHGGGTFTGPTLWSSDPAIFAQPSGGNGSHLDMLHGSPYSMGIAHEADNVFWVYDDWNKDIVRYDFVDDHGPGNDDHSDAIVRRYKSLGIDADGDVPNHMVMDKTNGWLYFVDNGNDRVMRIDINSGSVSNSLPLINEDLAEHSEMDGFTVETIIEAGLDRPCGIEIIENRLLVGDYATGDIIVFDMDNNFEEMGRIATNEAGLTGIKIGPDGSIWYTNRLQNTLVKVEVGSLTSTEEEVFAAQISVSPNPSSGDLSVSIPELGSGSTISLELSDLTGKKYLTLTGKPGLQQLDLSNLANGMYLLTIHTEKFSTTEKVILAR